jgi:hypothetical protein
LPVFPNDFITGRSLEGLLLPVLADTLLVVIQENVGGERGGSGEEQEQKHEGKKWRMVSLNHLFITFCSLYHISFDLSATIFYHLPGSFTDH